MLTPGKGPLGIPLQLLPGPRSSSGDETGTSGFLSSANMELRVPLAFPQGSQVSSHVETCKSALLLSWKSIVRLPVWLTLASVAISRGATGLSHLPSCFESILEVIVESVQGSQVVSGVHWDIAIFQPVGRPLELLSSVKLSPPPLEVRQDPQDSFPDEAGKWTLISR